MERVNGVNVGFPASAKITPRESYTDPIYPVVSNPRFMMAPRGLSAAQVAYWDGVFRRTIASPEWRKALAQEQWVDQYIGSAEARAHIDRHYAQVREILTDLGMAKQP